MESVLGNSGELTAAVYAAAESQALAPPAWVGPGIGIGAFMLIGGAIWMKVRGASDDLATEAAREAAFRARLQDFHPRLHHAVTVLHDDWKARTLWVDDLKIVRSTAGRISAWPQLAPSRPGAEDPDDGIRPLGELGMQVRLSMPPGCEPDSFIKRTDAITSALDVKGTRYVSNDGKHVLLELRGDVPTPDPALLAKLPERLHPAVATLSDPWEAAKLWVSKMGMGTDATPTSPADWPNLIPSPPELDPPDNGIRPMPVGAHIRAKIPHGWSAADFANKAEDLKAVFDAKDVTVVYNDGETVCLELRVCNPLGDTVDLPEDVETPVNLEALRVGMQEDGNFYRIAIRGNHILLAGLTGSGKSSGLWSIIGALCPAILTGHVQVHMIDLKRGTEMSAGHRLYQSWATKPTEAIRLLEDMVTLMRERADAYTAVSMESGKPLRKHIPTADNPHHVIMLDELIALLKLPGKTTVIPEIPNADGDIVLDKKGGPAEFPLTAYATLLLLELLSQARALGITVIMATQNAAKEIMDLVRDMIPTLVGLRQASVEQERMVFGPGAKDRGVRTTEISPDEAGMVFVDQTESGRSATRARFFYVSDDKIERMVATYGRKRTLALPAAPGAPANVLPMATHRPDPAAPPKPRICQGPKCTVVLDQSPVGRTKLYHSEACRKAAERARAKKAAADGHAGATVN
ncbi:FtsK/SpoIIIE domain-containing protein [Nocardia sp. NPDC050435]|uniref:FtsK/SpoIIIE domain-containing protein n=1 Tax=Nocardia sp. NPDC050435 TaxID=3155040 RepID=UPI0033EB7779